MECTPAGAFFPRSTSTTDSSSYDSSTRAYECSSTASSCMGFVTLISSRKKCHDDDAEWRLPSGASADQQQQQYCRHPTPVLWRWCCCTGSMGPPTRNAVYSSGPSVVPVARYTRSAYGIARHGWDQPVCVVVPVAAIGPVLLAGAYTNIGTTNSEGTTTALLK